MRRIRAAVAAGSADACAKAAQALKSMSYNIGARRLPELAGEVESAGCLRCPLHAGLPVRPSVEKEAMTERLAAKQAAASRFDAAGVAV
jgi:hypothetical protein